MSDKNILQKSGEHPFAPYVRILGKGKKGSRSLNFNEAYDAMRMILEGEVLDLQLGAFLMLLRVKEETPEELSGFAQAVKNTITVPQSIHADIDWSSYAGKRRHLPWYLLSTLLLAQQGIRIFMHGASGHTANRLYTESVLTELGFPLCSSFEQVKHELDKSNLAYMPLKHISPRLAEIINMRNILGLRSPVHSLARLINPLNARCVLQGIFHPPYAQLHQQAARSLGYHCVAVIKGEGGEIERNPDNALTAKLLLNGETFDETWPALFERRHVKASELSIEYLKHVWQGSEQNEYGEAAIISTCALALRCHQQIPPNEAIEHATKIWEQRDKSLL